jgi:hypothetical protein
MRRALVAALVLLVGCVDFVDVTSPEYVQPGFAAARVVVSVQQPVDGVDSLQAGGWIGVQAAQLQFVDDSLRVLGRALRPRPGIPDDGIDLTYDSTFAIAPGSLGAGTAGVTLPVVKRLVFVPAAFQVPVWIRSGPSRLSVPRGTDLAFPVTEGAASAELGPVQGEGWGLYLRRGQHTLNINASGALPARIVVPAGTVPADTSGTLTVEVTAGRYFTPTSRGDSTRMAVFSRSRIQWSVELTP